MTLQPGTRVIILASPIAEISGREGVIEAQHDEGYAVRISSRTAWCEPHELRIDDSNQHITTP